MATFPENVLGILLFCGCVMVIGVIQVRRRRRLSLVSSPFDLAGGNPPPRASPPQSVIVVYAFSRPFLLNEQIQISENQTFYKRNILKVIMRVPLMCFIASVFSFILFQLVGDVCPVPAKHAAASPLLLTSLSVSRTRCWPSSSSCRTSPSF